MTQSHPLCCYRLLVLLPYWVVVVLCYCCFIVGVFMVESASIRLLPPGYCPPLGMGSIPDTTSLL